MIISKDNYKNFDSEFIYNNYIAAINQINYFSEVVANFFNITEEEVEDTINKYINLLEPKKIRRIE